MFPLDDKTRRTDHLLALTKNKRHDMGQTQHVLHNTSILICLCNNRWINRNTTHPIWPRTEVWDRMLTVGKSSCSSGCVDWLNMSMLSTLFKDRTLSDWTAYSDAECPLQETWSHVYTYAVIWFLEQIWMVDATRESQSFFVLPLWKMNDTKTSTKTEWCLFALSMKAPVWPAH